ncbi:MAG: tetratricopeptide repeat protein [Phycisphaeraceae bacterium]|nr:tetratricopeptide repeat protein [Phycisphaeraceae bacterium]
MAGKVNTRFVVALSAALVLLIVGLGVVWYMRGRTDPADAIARGDGFFAEGHYDKAAAQYKIALSRRRNDVDLLIRYGDTLQQVRVDSVAAAQDAISQIINVYRNALEMAPNNDAAFSRISDVFMQLGTQMNELDAWNQLYKIAATAVNADPSRELPKRYRGIAQVHRMMAIDLSASDRQQTLDDLLQVHKAQPADPEVTYYLALMHLMEADAQDRPGGDPKLVKRNRQDAETLLKELARQFPDDPQVQLHRVRLLTAMKQNDAADAVLKELEKKLLSSPDSTKLVIETTQRMLADPRGGLKAYLADAPSSAAPTEMMTRAEAMLRKALSVHDNDLRLVLELGRLLTLENRDDEAMAAYRKAAEAKIAALPMVAYQTTQLKRQARIQYADLKLRQAQNLGDEQARPALEEVDAIVRELRTELGDNPFVNLLGGQVQMARQQWGEALKSLDRASKQFNDARPDVLMLSARVCVKLGELGAAVSRMESLLALRPDYLPARLDLAELYLRTAQPDKARSHVEAYLAKKPDDYHARSLMASYYAQSNDMDRAIRAYLELGLEQHPELVLRTARLLAATNRLPEGLKLLKQRLAQDPKDLPVLSEMIRWETDAGAAKAAIDAARKAGADPEKLDVLASRIGDPTGDKTLEAMRKYVASVDDPLQRALMEYRLALQTNQMDKADAAVTEAVKIRPDDPQVVQMQFDMALRHRDWPAAEKMVQKARDGKSELAEGDLLAGKLELARGRANLAVGYLKRLTQARPVFSEGWRLLGDAQRRIGDSAGAIESLRHAVDQKPDNVEARQQLAGVLDSTGQSDQALSQLRQAAQYPSINPLLREQYLAYEQKYGDPQRALGIRQRLAKVNPADTVNRRGLAALYAQLKKLPEAEAEMKSVFAAEPDEAANYGTYAAILAMAGQQEQGRQFLLQWIASRGPKAGVDEYIMLARYGMSIGNLDAGLDAYHKAIGLDKSKEQIALREMADMLFELGRNDAAVEAYRKLWKDDDQDSRVGQRLTEALIRGNKLDDAKAVLAKLTSVNSQDANLYLLGAQIAKQEGNDDEAIKQMNKAVEIAPDRATVQFERANLLAQNPRTEPDAIDALNRALDLNPNLFAARRLLAQIHLRRDDRQQAVRELQAILNRKPDDVPTRLQLLRMYLNGSDLLSAKSLLGESRQQFPQSARWPLLQSEVALQENNRRQAVEHLAEAMKLEPTRETLRALAQQWLAMGKAQEALDALKARPELLRDDAVCQALEGRAMQVGGSAAAAQAVFQQAMAKAATIDDVVGVGTQIIGALGLEAGASLIEHLTSPTQANWAQLAITRAEVGAGRYREAANRINRILPRIPDPEKQHFRGLLAMAHHNLGEFDQAAGVYRQVIQDDPDDVTVMNNLAYLLAVNLKKPQDAMTFAQRAGVLSPDDPQVLDTLGWVQFCNSRVADAEQTLRRSVRIKPMPANTFHLAEVLLAGGQKRYAAELYAKAKQLAELSKDQAILEQVQQRLKDVTP